ncbi:MAG: flagellar biosynthetic protein FliO [Comamonas sp.]|nr:flagellar biosynthetic protein FliO [Comamonas sp.]
MSAGASASSLVWVVVFIGAIATLPWLVRRWQRGRSALPGAASAGSRVLSSVAVGPQQRVVTVEAGTAQQRVVLVLGVTAAQINCLHVLPASSTFAGEMVVAQGAQKHD